MSATRAAEPVMLQDNGNNVDFGTVLENINTMHFSDMEKLPKENIRNYERVLESQEVGLSESELVSITNKNNFNAAASLTPDQAKKDIDLLFRSLFYCYGPYEFFGGKPAFDEAQQKLIKKFETFGESFSAAQLEEAIRSTLAFINDGHLLVNDVAVNKHETYYCDESIPFFKDEKGYYTGSGNQKRYLISVEGSGELDDYMKLSIDNEGKLVYYLGTLMTSGQQKRMVSAAFEDVTKAIALYESVTPSSYEGDQSGPSGIPVIACRDFDQYAEDFIGSAGQIASSPVAILDIRGNSLGRASTAEEWLKAYGPEVTAGNFNGVGSSFLYSKAYCYIYAENLSRYQPLSSDMSVKEEYDFYMKEYKYNTNQCIQYVDSERKLSFGESETLLFVLTDNETASSAENLIAALRGRENVIFAGTNSRGRMLSGPGCRVRLPASGIFVSFGPMLQFFYDESVYTENRGFYPDIWVSGDALKKINSLISRYSITGVN
jgi:hypothetical protein